MYQVIETAALQKQELDKDTAADITFWIAQRLNSGYKESLSSIRFHMSDDYLVYLQQAPQKNESLQQIYDEYKRTKNLIDKEIRENTFEYKLAIVIINFFGVLIAFGVIFIILMLFIEVLKKLGYNVESIEEMAFPKQPE